MTTDAMRITELPLLLLAGVEVTAVTLMVGRRGEWGASAIEIETVVIVGESSLVCSCATWVLYLLRDGKEQKSFLFMVSLISTK